MRVEAVACHLDSTWRPWGASLVTTGLLDRALILSSAFF
jgi:hypothetical protein